METKIFTDGSQTFCDLDSHSPGGASHARAYALDDIFVSPDMQMHRLDALTTSTLARTAPMELNVSHAVAEREEHMRRDFASYELHAEKCKRHLRRFIATNPDRNCLVYIVPLVTMDAMLRDARKVINHVINALTRSGFSARYLGNSYIFIWWDTRNAGSQYIVPDHVGASERSSHNNTPAGSNSNSNSRQTWKHRGIHPQMLLDMPIATHDASDTQRIEAEIAARTRDAGYAPRVTALSAVGRRRHTDVFDGVSSHEEAVARVLARTR